MAAKRVLLRRSVNSAAAVWSSLPCGAALNDDQTKLLTSLLCVFADTAY
jgi:hypothetical protein